MVGRGWVEVGWRFGGGWWLDAGNMQGEGGESNWKGWKHSSWGSCKRKMMRLD